MDIVEISTVLPILTADIILLSHFLFQRIWKGFGKIQAQLQNFPKTGTVRGQNKRYKVSDWHFVSLCSIYFIFSGNIADGHKFFWISFSSQGHYMNDYNCNTFV